MIVLKATLSVPGGPPRDAEIELDFTSEAWSIKNGKFLWPGVVFSERGTFERKPWGGGVIWLMDGPGTAVTRNTVILRGAPLDENDGGKTAGSGRVFDPANPSLKDCQISWSVVRRTAPASATAQTGARTAVRKRVLEACAEIFPQKTNGLIYFTSERRKAGSKVTNCGVFPGMVFGRVPVIPPTQRGAFKVSGPLYLTSPMTAWEQFAQLVDKEKKPPKNTWVPFSGNRPLPGDIYVLKYELTEDFQHVGIIVSPEGGEWITADGGQGANDGYQGGFVKRKFESSGLMTGEFGNKARLKGWVDLDNLYAVAKAAFPPNLG